MNTELTNKNILAIISLCIITWLLSFASSLSIGLLYTSHWIKINSARLTTITLFIAGSIMMHYFVQLRLQRAQLSFIKDRLKATWDNVIYAPYPTINTLNPTTLINILNNHESALFITTEKSLALLNESFIILLLFAAMCYLQISLAIIYLLVLVILFSIKITLYPSLNNKTVDYLNHQQKSDLYLHETLCQIDKIKTAHLEAYTLKKWITLSSHTKHSLKELGTMEAKLVFTDGIVSTFLVILSLYQHASGVFLLCAGQLLLCYTALNANLLELHSQKTSLKQIDLISQRIITPSDPPVSFPFSGSIQLCNVSFNSLHHVTMNIEPGSFVGLTGDSGSGKSTLFRLILGLESGYTGTISLDHIDIQSLNLTNTRKNIGVVLQTSRLFPGTIYSNIANNTNMAIDEIWNIVRIVDLEDEINNMPMKLFTLLSDHNNSAISGGQRQKILLARALASNPTALLLDEATSALDEVSQANIFNNLQSLNITRVVIAHRLNTLTNADKIYRLENGRVTIVDRMK